jgi:mRNA interferase MazF
VPERGDIVLTRFPFTDRSGAKLRPVLVLAKIPGPHEDFVALFISSQLSQAVSGLDIVLEPADQAFRGSGLKVASVFRIGKVASISDALMAGTLGRLDAPIFDEIIRRLVRLLESR